ncbi:VTC domain-containing protein [Virgisporangium aliadipatigenens]|uniref:VTC domain-containing protein n=1 Tax=Virgisporangium aliadipatigenens TaxID=741659 RepID=A0A8J4DPJ7_9ACTN|nr:polyphosphate polymerase domain-containing protein [Virgisporangium aliadipatigenens]GIJ46015.1 VTC domain-containing protein [Virgisporangium aliadipatigenens]
MSELAGLPGIGLAELIERAALLTRIDRKYVLSRAGAFTLVQQLGPLTRVLDVDGLRQFRYASVYFDTAELTCFRLAAHRRRRRFKIRTRTYLDSAECWLEVKTRGTRAGTVKNRHPYRADDGATIAPGRGFVDAALAGLAAPRDLAPVLVTRYRRATLLLPGDAGRLTVDVDLAWEDADGRRLDLPGVAVVETKSRSGASPVDRLLWARGNRPVALSKYATGLAALRPDLPATPWRRTLRRWFVPSEGKEPSCLAPDEYSSAR